MRDRPYLPSENKSKKLFELIHMDTVAACDESIYGNKYFLSILDNYTRYGWVYFLKSKKEIYDVFVIWNNMINNIFNKIIKHIRCDNGLEFDNNKMKEFCNANVIFEPSIHTVINRMDELKGFNKLLSPMLTHC